jgi:phage recombination protein Bet
MNTTALVPHDVAPVTADQLELIKRTVANGATADELKLYLYDCARQGVHPLDKLIHFTKRNNRYTPVTSIDLMRTRAADTGEYAGSDDATFTGGDKAPSAATVTVWRLVQGQRCAFTATARWAEYYPGDGPAGSMWRKMPATMLAKCSEALALRKGFPRQLAGLYAREELDQADREPAAIVGDVGAAVPSSSEPASSPSTSSAPAPAAAASETVWQPSGLYEEPGLTYIRTWRPGFGRAKAFITHNHQTGLMPEGLAVYKDADFLRDSCVTGSPVELDIKVANSSGNPYVNGAKAVKRDEPAARAPESAPPMLTDDDIAF